MRVHCRRDHLIILIIIKQEQHAAKGEHVAARNYFPCRFKPGVTLSGATSADLGLFYHRKVRSKVLFPSADPPRPFADVGYDDALGSPQGEIY